MIEFSSKKLLRWTAMSLVFLALAAGCETGGEEEEMEEEGMLPGVEQPFATQITGEKV